MCKKYVILAVCAALVITLIHAPDSCGKARAAKSFDGKVWVRIDELEGDPWSEVAIYRGNQEPGNQKYFLIFVPYFNISIQLLSQNCVAGKYDRGIQGNRVGVVERLHQNKWRP